MTKRILVVDDEEVVLISCEKILKGMGFELKLFQNPEEALKELKENDYSLIISDVVMPQMNGIELFRRSREIKKDVEVILITGYPNLKEAVTAIQEGVFQYITKPFEPNELREAVKRAMEEIEKRRKESFVSFPSAKEPAWMHDYRKKLCSADEAISLIKDGDNVYISANAATPLAMERALYAQRDRFKRLNLIHVLLAGEDILNVKDPSSPFRHLSLFVGPADREAIALGNSEYMPIFLHEIPSIFYSGKVKLDAAILHVSKPDEHGFVSLGVECLASLAAADCAKILIAQVNEKMPYILGDNFIHISRFNKIVEVSEDILELKGRGATEVEKKIGAFIADLIPDGATLQMGIGGIPDAVLAQLEGKKDLGIHTEMVSDGLIKAFNKGIITNARKTLHRNKIIGTFVYGSKQLYEFVDHNPLIELHPVNYVNDPRIICQNENMVAINSAIEVDITGQVCSDSIGTTIYSGFGGQVDFIRGAAMAKNGKPIIALPSTTKNDTVSRIVPKLKPGAGVVTSRADIHYLCTEFGIVDLHGKTLQQRARAIIELAHPNFRDMLIEEAKERKIW